ncbi:serine/threonine-protein kinase [Kytococcus sp. Marseille-QA3725]
MVRVHELVEDGWRPGPAELRRLVRDVGADLTRLHEGGAVHGGVSAASVERQAGGGFRLRPGEAAGDDPWLVEPPEVVDGDAPTPASDAYELAVLTRRLVEEVEWPVPEGLVVAVQRALREDPAARPSVTAFVVCSTEELDEVDDASQAAGDETVAGDPGDLPTGERVPAEPAPGEEPEADHLHPDDGEPGPTGLHRTEQERLEELRASLRAAAQDPPRSGLRSGVPGGRRALLAGAAGLVVVVGAWSLLGAGEAPTAEGVPTAVADDSGATPTSAGGATEGTGEPTVPTSSTDSGSTDPTPQDSATTVRSGGRAPGAAASEDPDPSQGIATTSDAREAALPSETELEELLGRRATAWAEGDREALATVVVPDSPAWERDTGELPPEELGEARYRVEDLRPARERSSARGDRRAVTASVAVGDRDARTVQLVLQPHGNQWRLADWELPG